MPGVPAHQEYLWGNPAFACVWALVERFANDGWEMRTERRRHQQIAAARLRSGGRAAGQACAEVLLTEREIDWILDRGYMALARSAIGTRSDWYDFNRSRSSGAVIGPLDKR